jgi:hypothetical protein
MKLVKDNAVDKDAYAKMIDSKVKDDAAFWRQPLKDALDQCQKPITASAAKIEEMFSKAPIGIKKEDCDPQFLVMFLCLHLDSFAVRDLLRVFYCTDISSHSASSSYSSLELPGKGLQDDREGRQL